MVSGLTRHNTSGINASAIEGSPLPVGKFIALQESAAGAVLAIRFRHLPTDTSADWSFDIVMAPFSDGLATDVVQTAFNIASKKRPAFSPNGLLIPQMLVASNLGFRPGVQQVGFMTQVTVAGDKVECSRIAMQQIDPVQIMTARDIPLVLFDLAKQLAKHRMAAGFWADFCADDLLLVNAHGKVEQLETQPLFVSRLFFREIHALLDTAATITFHALDVPPILSGAITIAARNGNKLILTPGYFQAHYGIMMMDAQPRLRACISNPCYDYGHFFNHRQLANAIAGRKTEPESAIAQIATAIRSTDGSGGKRKGPSLGYFETQGFVDLPKTKLLSLDGVSRELKAPGWILSLLDAWRTDPRTRNEARILSELLSPKDVLPIAQSLYERCVVDPSLPSSLLSDWSRYGFVVEDRQTSETTSLGRADLRCTVLTRYIRTLDGEEYEAQTIAPKKQMACSMVTYELLQKLLKIESTVEQQADVMTNNELGPEFTSLLKKCGLSSPKISVQTADQFFWAKITAHQTRSRIILALEGHVSRSKAIEEVILSAIKKLKSDIREMEKPQRLVPKTRQSSTAGALLAQIRARWQKELVARQQLDCPGNEARISLLRQFLVVSDVTRQAEARLAGYSRTNVLQKELEQQEALWTPQGAANMGTRILAVASAGGDPSIGACIQLTKESIRIATAAGYLPDEVPAFLVRAGLVSISGTSIQLTRRGKRQMIEARAESSRATGGCRNEYPLAHGKASIMDRVSPESLDRFISLK